jgi:hypothetical protein
MKQRDPELGKGWVQIVHTLSVETIGGAQNMLCANTEGIFRIIQSIPSPKAEPFKRWLAKVGYERVQEIEDPELGSKRTRALYKAKGYLYDAEKARDYDFAVADVPDGAFFMFYGELFRAMSKNVDLIDLSGDATKFKNLVLQEGKLIYDKAAA